MFEWVLLLSGTAVAVPMASIGMVRWRLRRRLRVAPHVRSQVPTTWLAPVSPPARLHRRLRDVAATARVIGAQAGRTTPVADLCADVQRQAVEIEGHLLIVSRVKRGGAPARRAIVQQIEQLEALTRRLGRTALEARRPVTLAGESADPLGLIAERLDVLDDARRELAAVERSAGLGR